MKERTNGKVILKGSDASGAKLENSKKLKRSNKYFIVSFYLLLAKIGFVFRLRRYCELFF
jgi:hypothetical protein